MTVIFTVPGQPQGKGRPRIVRIAGQPRNAPDKKTVAYEGLIAYAAQSAMAGRPMFEGPVVVDLELNCQMPASWSKRKQAAALAGELVPTTKPDIDNVVKAVFDGCNGVLWRDDVQAYRLSVVKRYSTSPCVRVKAAQADLLEACA